ERLLDRLTIAARAGFVRESALMPERYEFVHALVRETLYGDLPPPTRAQLHREIARALEARGTGAPAVAEIAHHYAHAASLGERRKAIEYALAAGDRAIASLGYEEACGHYRRALETLQIERADLALEVRIRLKLADAAWRSGDHAGAREEFRKAGESARTIGDAEAIALAAIGFAEAWPQAGVTDERPVRLLEDALAALGEGDSVLRARALAALAVALFGAPMQHERRDRVSFEAVAMARRLGDPGALGS